MFELGFANLVVAGVLVLLILLALWRVDALAVAASQRVQGRSRWLDGLMRACSYTPLVVLVLYLAPSLYLLWQGEPLSVLLLTTVCVLSLGVTFALKYFVMRARPLGHVTYLGRQDSSFPSAHTAGAVSAALTDAYLWPELVVPVAVLAVLVAVSRLYWQLHYVSDLLGGVLVAYGFFLFSVYSDFIPFYLSLLGSYVG
jgi:undecaprenyl-diphosphatase